MPYSHIIPPDGFDENLAKAIHDYLDGWYYTSVTSRHNGAVDVHTQQWLTPEGVTTGKAVDYNPDLQMITINDTYGVYLLPAKNIRTVVLDRSELRFYWFPEKHNNNAPHTTVFKRESRIPEPEDPETLEKVLDRARDDFRSDVRYDTEVDGEDIYLPRHPGDIIMGVADSCVPVYNRDLLDVASSDMGILTDEPEFEVDGGPLGVIRANIYTRIEQDLYEYWEELQDMDPEELAHELDLELETEEEDQDEA